MGPLWVLAFLIVAAAAVYGPLVWWRATRLPVRDFRETSNAHVRQVYEDAGMLTYPHEMSSGKVRWMNVYGSHGNALDL
jgi:hypothetical protein